MTSNRPIGEWGKLLSNVPAASERDQRHIFDQRTAEDVVTGSAVKKRARRVSNPADLQSQLLLLSLRLRLYVEPHQLPRPVASRRQRMPVVDL